MITDKQGKLKIDFYYNNKNKAFVSNFPVYAYGNISMNKKNNEKH